MRWLKLIGITVGVLLALAILLFIQPWALLPHKHIEIGLPFKPSVDAITSLIPMGEKIEHNESNGTPDGHPGIDFGWDEEVEIIAVADGRITRITHNSEGQIIVEQQMGFYRTAYQELNKLAPGIKWLSKVRKGQLIGYTGAARIGEGRPNPGDPSRQLHWDFSSASTLVDRLCPVTYFDAESRQRIERIWANVPDNNQFKVQYPEICNGVFKDKVD